MYIPKMYIRTYWVSIDRPDINRVNENQGKLPTKEVKKSPEAPVKVDRTQAGRRPMRSAKYPKNILPSADPIKKKD